MATRIRETDAVSKPIHSEMPNGAALAAFAAASFGSFAIGFIVLLNEVGIFTPPTLYGPAGGVSGRTTLAIVVWLLAWGMLHLRWRNRQLDAGRISMICLMLIAGGVIATFPPLWGLL